MIEWQLLRVFIDTNIWISVFISPFGPPAAIISEWQQGRFVPIVSEALVDEIRTVLMRPRIQRRLRRSQSDINALLDEFGSKARYVTPTGTLHLCRDPNDDIMIETAILGRADYIVSRDDDLKRDLALMATLRAYGTEVLTVAQFLDLLDQR